MMSDSFDFSTLKIPETRQNIIVIGDFLKDLDDEHTLCGLAGLQKLGFIDLRCVVANLAPAELRARGARGTLDKLHLEYVPVGVGLPVFDGKTYPYEENIPYLSKKEAVNSNGAALIIQSMIMCPNKSVTLILQSGMTDATKLLANFSEIFVQKVKEVVIMGGVKTEGNAVKLSSDGMMSPNNANNNSFDMMSAVWLYRQLQRLNIPMIITTREVAYAAQVPFSAYDELEKTGNPIAICLKNRQGPMVQSFWEAACSPAGSRIRGTLPIDRDRGWFVKAFCDGKDPGIAADDDIWPYVARLTLYDPTNLYTAIPELRKRFLKPTVVRIDKTDHLVVGISSTEHGVLNSDEFARFMVSIELLGLQN